MLQLGSLHKGTEYFSNSVFWVFILYNRHVHSKILFQETETDLGVNNRFNQLVQTTKVNCISLVAYEFLFLISD